MIFCKSIYYNKKHTPPVFTVFVQFIILLGGISSVELSAKDVSESMSYEGHYYFTDKGIFVDQLGKNDNGISFTVETELSYTWADYQKLDFERYFYWNVKEKRTLQASIEKFNFASKLGAWKVKAGNEKVNWGVTESKHLVDIINQTNAAVEGLSHSEKRSQPLFHVSRRINAGKLDLYVLPYFKEQKFIDRKWHFRTPLKIDEDATTYESSKQKKHVDYVVRWTRAIKKADIGIHYFKGTSRNPTLNTVLSDGKAVGLQAHYPQITQTGIDLKVSNKPTIWKLEVMNRNFSDTNYEDYTAVVAGIERELQTFNSSSKISLLAEYLHDSRGEVPEAEYQNDLFLGARFVFKDKGKSNLLVGTVVDLDNNAKSFRVEASRKLGKDFSVNVEAQAFTEIDHSNVLEAHEKYDYIQVGIQKLF